MEKKGFVDPATEEFDLHMERNQEGYVVGKTPLGKNMCELLHLDIRRTDLFWKISQLHEQREQLEKLFEQGLLKEEEKDIYIEINMLLRSYLIKTLSMGE